MSVTSLQTKKITQQRVLWGIAPICNIRVNRHFDFSALKIILKSFKIVTQIEHCRHCSGSRSNNCKIIGIRQCVQKKLYQFNFHNHAAFCRAINKPSILIQNKIRLIIAHCFTKFNLRRNPIPCYMSDMFSIQI